MKQQEYFDRLVESTGDVYWGNKTAAGIRRFKRKALLVAKELSIFKDPAVLELGCGTGGFSKGVLEELPSVYLVGCDISGKAIRVATGCNNIYKRAYFEQADVDSLPHRRNTFDAVIGNAILHHSSDIETVLQESFRVLKPGGIIWFVEPNMMNPQIAIERNIRFIGKMLQNTKDETAFFRWPLARTLGKIGFRNVTVKPFDFVHPFTPRSLVSTVDHLGRLIERAPLLREIAGSLLICARKSGTNRVVPRHNRL